MPRTLDLAAAQLGPIARDEGRASAVERLIALLREAKAHGCRLVVFPEMALTTFFPRWALQDRAEAEGYFEREMPGPDTGPLFDEARRLGIAFYLGYCELTEEDGRPAESRLRGFHHLITMQAGAYQNSLWVAASAKAGHEEGVDMMGLSCVIAPTGEVVAQSAGVGDELIAYGADLDMAADYRRYFAFEKNRRPELYGPITAQAGIDESEA